MDRVAVIGFGNIATRHRRNLRSFFPKAVIYAMSSSGRKPEAVPADVDYIVESVSELIELKVELIIIASPAPFHSSHAIPLIQAGIPVLIEKPVCTNEQDTQELESAIANFSTPVAVGYCIRYLSSARKMKEYILSGMFGKIYHCSIDMGQYLPDWRPHKDYRETVSAQSKLGGGVLLELSHELDYAQWIFGELDLQYALLKNSGELEIDVEDSADLLFLAKHGVCLNVHLDFLQQKVSRRCKIISHAGVVDWDLVANEIRICTNGSEKLLFSDPSWEPNQMYLDMLTDFLSLINGDDSQAVSVSEASKTVALIENAKSKFPIKKVIRAGVQ
ncbi:Gfo/Idh/MocA family oxidoreductase [Pseudoalteromonas sp. JBTF-M23]|uniref:Gfo/Idh/MocA family oxidoreductase n=1 Tax=Pseudoalteromonas caenipelagi TaxID=2726988 RepID=A0A849VEE9_9GAMM|nr:Gfo/Idh/MocA family oxidoreductase [Pseudoalteromonas caenipelagi]NOU51772.1 Gfo/Idh/MocA family oxidoreductase [Pseudoalteromonas caenipelagi]